MFPTEAAQKYSGPWSVASKKGRNQLTSKEMKILLGFGLTGFLASAAASHWPLTTSYYDRITMGTGQPRVHGVLL
jgi:hypothetical protein